MHFPLYSHSASSRAPSFLLHFVLFILIASGAPLFAQANPKFKVLCIGLPDPNHPQTGAAGIKAVQEIAMGQDYTVDAITDMGKVDDAFLAPYQVIVCVMAWQGEWPKPAQAAFEKFAEAGKGWIGFHVSGLVGISNPEWTWYQNWLGGITFKGHPGTRQTGTVKVEASAVSHPALAGVPASFSIHEEWYAWNKSPRGQPDIAILATVDETSYDPQGTGMGKDHPVMWSNTKYGPMIYTSLGHEPEAFGNAAVRKFLANAIPWAAKSSVAAVSPGLRMPAGGETPMLRWDGHRLTVSSLSPGGSGAVAAGLDGRSPGPRAFHWQDWQAWPGPGIP
jgi:type 1 glutamine amidotransferase